MMQTTARQRVLMTLRGQIPDRIATAFHNSAVVAELSGLPYNEFFRSGEAMADGHYRALQRFQYDAIIVDSGTHCSAQTLGCGAHYSADKYPLTTTPVLQHLEDIRSLEMPDPCSTYPASEMIDCIHRLRGMCGEEAALIATGDQGPFTLSALLIGMENWLLALKDQIDLDLIHEVLDFACRYTTSYALALHTAGADVVRFGDSFGGTELVSPRMYTQWTYPYEKQLIEALTPHGFPTSIHICGNATPILEGMIASGADMIEVDEKTNFDMACQACAGRAALLGPVSPAHMVFLDAWQVKDEARQAIETARRHRTRLLLGAGCSMAGNTPHTSLDVVIDAAHEFGCYNE
jgi:MtaA/CmuA family methyltransferase